MTDQNENVTQVAGVKDLVLATGTADAVGSQLSPALLLGTAQFSISKRYLQNCIFSAVMCATAAFLLLT